MLKSITRFALVAGAALLVLAVVTTTSQAQTRVVPQAYTGPRIIGTSATLVNPNAWVAPYTTLNQYQYNVRTLGRAYQTVPPWVYGYNPYPNPIIVTPYYNPYPTYTPSYNPYLYGGYNPYQYSTGNLYGIYR